MPQAQENAYFAPTHNGESYECRTLLAEIIRAERRRKTGDPMSYVEKKTARRMAQVFATLISDGYLEHNGRRFFPQDGIKIADNREGKNARKLGRLASRLFPSVRSQIRTTVAQTVQTRCWKTGTLHIARGQDLIDAYDSFGDFSATSACMTGSGRSDYLSVYEDNPDIIAAAYYKVGTEIVARRLVWSYGADHYLDRQYPNHETAGTRRLESALISELSANGDNVWLRDHHSQGRSAFHHAANAEPRASVSIPVNSPFSGKMPYLDTFQYSATPPDCGDEIMLHNTRIDSGVHYIDTSGGWEDNRRRCTDCGDYGTADEIAGNRCDYCTERQREAQAAEERRRAQIRARFDVFPTPATITTEDHGKLYLSTTRTADIGRFGMATNSTRRFIIQSDHTCRIDPNSTRAEDRHHADKWREIPARWHELATGDPAPEHVCFVRVTKPDTQPYYFRLGYAGQVSRLHHLHAADNVTLPEESYLSDWRAAENKVEYLTPPTAEELDAMIQALTTNNESE